MRRLLVTLACLFAMNVEAQIWDRLTNPNVDVNVRHPPGIGFTVHKIAFAPLSMSTPCSEQFFDSVTIDFVNSGIEVLDRAHLQDMLAEHKFNFSGYVDESTSAKLGKMTGANALVFVKVIRCDLRHEKKSDQWKDKQGNTHYRHFAITYVDFTASVQTVDLATGRKFGAVEIDETASRTASEEYCCPDYPDTHDAQDEVIDKGVLTVHRMFLPWTENLRLNFFDDVPCNLKLAFRMMAGGDYEGALEQSIKNAESCVAGGKTKEKVVWHAQYNVAMAHFVLGNYDNALHYFNLAMAGGGGTIVSQGMNTCRNAKKLAEEMQRVEQRSATDLARAKVEETPKNTSGKSKEPTKGGSDDVESRLAKLKSMLDKGLITKADYDTKKAQLLKEY